MRRLICATALTLWLVSPARNAVSGPPDKTSTAIVEDAGPVGALEPSPTGVTPSPPGAHGPAAPSNPTSAQPAKRKVSRAHRRKVRAVEKIPTEPIDVRLEITRDSWAFERPTQRSRRIKRIHAGKYVHVTALTPYYLRVELKNGTTAYVDPQVVKMLWPANKILMLADDSPVRERPNKWAKELAEVNKGHHVQVVGVAPGYVQIRMRSGLEGFIPYSVLEGGAASVPKTDLLLN
jgi:hypothetical protein